MPLRAVMIIIVIVITVTVIIHCHLLSLWLSSRIVHWFTGFVLLPFIRSFVDECARLSIYPFSHDWHYTYIRVASTLEHYPLFVILRVLLQHRFILILGISSFSMSRYIFDEIRDRLLHWYELARSSLPLGEPTPNIWCIFRSSIVYFTWGRTPALCYSIYSIDLWQIFRL